MSFFPHSRVFVGPSKTVDIAGPHIQVLDSLTGNVLSSTANFSEEQKERVLESGPIRCAAVDRDLKYLLTSGEDKMLKLWEIDALKLLNERELPKRPTAVAFTSNAETLVVSDKFGDVFSYPFIYTPPTAEELNLREKERSRDPLASHENPSGGQLILGHVSPLNAFTLTPNERYIITADRDEHIRVSWFPKGYNIEMYCLGHFKFVSAVHIPTSDPSTLISGGGDPMLKIWDWMTGALKHELPVFEVIEPFIAVRVSKRKRGYGGEDDEGNAPEGSGSKGKGGRRKKGKKGPKETEAPAGQEEGEDTPRPEGAEKKEEEKLEKEKVLVIHRIESIESESGLHIVFSAVGATALFSFPYKLDVAPTDIRVIDFGKPVLDFSITGDAQVLVQLDAAWVSDASTASVTESTMVKVLKFSEGDLREDSETLKPLIDSLNSTSLLSATPEFLKRLALYSDLTSMPKNAEPEDDLGPAALEGMPTMLPIGAPEISSSETAKAKGKAKAELSKKEIGRIKGKQAVLAKAMEIEAGASVAGVARDVKEKKDEDVPERKKARSEVECGSGDGDVQMTEG
ncbi:WD40 repeat-like protein [Pholiota conissans]|uniref:WD40 repeat-like protein n=1 Tax=Pholiota conissans TaxID=109636 RepID=A0A9P5YU74_9AGAR|nr:WD40 repeat-like protein [Pholiota conissans]